MLTGNLYSLSTTKYLTPDFLLKYLHAYGTSSAYRFLNHTHCNRPTVTKFSKKELILNRRYLPHPSSELIFHLGSFSQGIQICYFFFNFTPKYSDIIYKISPSWRSLLEWMIPLGLIFASLIVAGPQRFEVASKAAC